MSRSDKAAAVERRIRRLAVRQGLHLLQVEKPDARVRQHGGYMLREVETARIVFGDRPYRFSADLEEIEAYLRGGSDEA